MITNNEEQWKRLPAELNASAYWISNTGRLWGYTSEIKRKQDVYGYIPTSLICDDGSRINTRLHRLVALTFIGPIPEGYVIHHKDGNKSNNHVSNLEIVTHQENAMQKIYPKTNSS